MDIKFSIRFFTAILIVTAILLVIIGIRDYYARQAINDLKARYLQVEQLRSQIIHFNEIMTMSARLAAATGDIRWGVRYREYEPKLNASLQQAVAVFPQIYRKETQRTGTGKIKLLQMEDKAFDLIRQGKNNEAMAILFGNQYEAQRNHYERIIEQLNVFLKEQIDAALAVENSKEQLAQVSFITVLILLLLSWLILLRITRGVQEALVASNRRLDEANKTLDQKARELKVLYDNQKEFSSTISHELRTPLASIKAALDIVISGSTGQMTGQQHDFLGRAKSNVDRLNRLINDILDLAHLQSGRTPLRIKPGDINETIRSVVAAQEGVARAKGLYLKMSFDDQVPVFPFDQDKIFQVLNNLIDNAIKFTPGGGITVSSAGRAASDGVEVRVQDTGCGIKEEDMVRLFERFQQLGGDYQRYTGTGLGLAICKEIVRQHGGQIGVESKVDQGSCFYFVLPIQKFSKG